MALTDHSDLYGSVHEDGINRVVRHIMRQRPSLFNYATPFFHQRAELFCHKIEVAQSVLDAGNPWFTEEDPLPILGTPVPMGINFCLQFTDAEIDFYPGNVIKLPPELGTLQAQRLALRFKACAGLDCPSKEFIDEYLPTIERLLVAQKQLIVGDIEETQRGKRKLPAQKNTEKPAAEYGLDIFHEGPVRKPTGVIVLPTRRLTCFCLEVFAVAHFEWGGVPGSQQQWLKAKLDGLEIVDITPEKMENAIECYGSTILRLGILPRLMIPMEKMVLDLAAQVKKWGLDLGKQVNLQPATVPADVPNNPAVEDDQIKAFINLVITP